MPSSVLLALLIGAVVLALVPALIRRYDSAVRRAHEDRTSVSRVLTRRRARFVPIYDTSHGSLFTDAVDDGQNDDDVETEEEPPQPAPSAERAAPALRRRWILLALLASAASCGALAMVMRQPLLWIGVGAALCGAVLVLRQARALARARAHLRVTKRAERAARKRRAQLFLATLSTHTRIDPYQAEALVEWLMLVPQERTEPDEYVTEVFAAANREAVCVNGRWVVQRCARPQLVHSQDDVEADQWGYVPEPFAPELERGDDGTYYRRAVGE
ncbi:MAG: hypothetical protein HOQ05_07785 [Corynebacteriales bacterium]|nr:hypothetical protein [Mycobacteriales bacterium]